MNCAPPFYGIIIFLSIGLNSQTYSQSPKALKLPAHTDVTTVSWYDSIYRFPDFQTGRITFRTGFSPAQTMKLNYNLYFLQLDMINETGDTVKLKPSEVLFDIGGHFFFYDSRKGYIEILHDSPIALGVLTQLVTAGKGNLEQHREGEYQTIDVRGQTSIYDRYYLKLHSYFFIDQKNELHPASKANIIKLFSGHKERIKVYLQERHIDFNKEADLIQLLTFCHQFDKPVN